MICLITNNMAYENRHRYFVRDLKVVRYLVISTHINDSYFERYQGDKCKKHKRHILVKKRL